MPDERFLVALDTDSIKSYIFASPRLIEIRGASHLLDWLNQKATKPAIERACPAADLIYTAGGSALVSVPTEADAQAVIAAVEKLYREKTVTASITGAYRKYAVDTADFGAEFRELGYLLRDRKDNKRLEIHVPIEGSLQPCPSCGEYPITEPDPVFPAERICRVCAIKREHGRGRPGQGDPQREARAFRWQWFRDGTGNKWEDVNLPEDLDDIGGASRPPNYIGFIYGDGNKMGKLLNSWTRQQEFRTFSATVKAVVEGAVRSAMDENLDPVSARGGKVAPFEVFLLGGDDFVIAVPGHMALPIAASIAERIAQAPQQPLGGEDKPLTVGIGVVIAHQSFPLEALFDLATDLQKEAKRKSSEQHDVSMIDFMVVQAASTRGVTELRRAAYSERVFRAPPRQLPTRPGIEKRLARFQLTRRPYSVPDLRQLLAYCCRLQREGFPAGRLHNLEAALFTGEGVAMREVQTALGRAAPQQRALLDEFFADFEGIGSLADGRPPWRRKIDGFSSGLADLAEIYPFQAPPTEAAPDARRERHD